MEWINVKDRLPEIKYKKKYSDVVEISDSVIAYERGRFYVVHLEYLKLKKEYIWTNELDDSSNPTIYEPSHWMPLPKPPNEN